MQFESLAQAVAHVQDGMCLALGGITLYRRPVALVRALLQRPNPPRDLTLLSFTAGYEADLLIGAGCIQAIRTAYCGLEAFGFAPMFTEAVHAGRLKVIEESEASLVMGIRAAIQGVAYLPSKAWQGTDLLGLRPDVHTVQDPYTQASLTAFPAIHCDVALIHALEADARGNVLLNSNLGIDLELIYAAQTVIVSAERLVERIDRHAEGVIVPYPGADVIVEAPLGAIPSSCYPFYPLDGLGILSYAEQCAEGRFAEYLTNFLTQ